MKIRNYTNQVGITEDYKKVRDFLIQRGYCEFVYARWDWMITHSYLDQSNLNKIQLWEVQDRIVGLVTFDTVLDTAYCITLPEYEYLKREMFQYIDENYCVNGLVKVVIPTNEVETQKIAYQNGFVATSRAEHDAIFYKGVSSLDYTLPEGYKLISMLERFDPYEYLNCLWKGFNHEVNGEGPLVYDETQKRQAKMEMFRDNVDLSLKLAVVNSEGHYVAYCGLWYDKQLDFGLIEPLATIPECRGLGLAKALVYEGVKRVFNQGADKVFVGSNQPFYYSIGMFPYQSHTIWEKKK